MTFISAAIDKQINNVSRILVFIASMLHFFENDRDFKYGVFPGGKLKNLNCCRETARIAICDGHTRLTSCSVMKKPKKDKV